MKEIKPPKYTKEEELYFAEQLNRIKVAQTARDSSHPEFDNLTYHQYWQLNEDGANTMIEYKKNKIDTVYQSGLLRMKMFAFLSSFQSLNLSPDITAYNESDIIINNLGEAIEEILEKTAELDDDEEKRLLREFEMLKQGTVFVEDLWTEEKGIRKGIKKNEIVTTVGKSISRPRREIISNLKVYLGDMKTYLIADQPFIFTVREMPYSKAQQIYGGYERWENVPKTLKSWNESIIPTTDLLLGAEANEDMVQVVMYQDKPANEIQLYLNAVAMYEQNYPLDKVSGENEYTIVQQNLEPIRHDFAYGQSFIFKYKNQVSIIDDMTKFAILKTHKSFAPPMLNMTNRILSKDIFAPGVILRNIRPGEVQPINEHEAMGVTSAEFNMIDKLKSSLDEVTVSPTTTGSMEGGTPTATQILETQRQAKQMIGLFVASAGWLEKKLAGKRVSVLLSNWFDPVGNRLDKARKILENKYRKVSRVVEGGEYRVVRLKDNPSTPEYLEKLQREIEKKISKPTKIFEISPKALKMKHTIWRINIVPKEKKTSELSRMLFSTMIQDAINLGLQPDPDYMKKRFAQVWGEDYSEMFPANTQEPEMMMPEGSGREGDNGQHPNAMQNTRTSLQNNPAKTKPNKEAIKK